MVTTTYIRSGDTAPGEPLELHPSTPEDELTRYVFFDETGLHVGTLRDYAKAWEEATAFGYHLSPEVRTWHTDHPVHVVYLGTDDEDYMHYRLTANDETVYAAIDGRV